MINVTSNTPMAGPSPLISCIQGQLNPLLTITAFNVSVE